MTVPRNTYILSVVLTYCNILLLFRINLSQCTTRSKHQAMDTRVVIFVTRLRLFSDANSGNRLSVNGIDMKTKQILLEALK